MKKEKKLSEYEYDALWMSYRYAIPRHSITSVMHAGNLVKYIYNEHPQLLKDKLDFIVFDMRREINSQLNWEFNFSLGVYVPQEFFDPFNVIIELSKKDEVIEAGGILKYLESHRFTGEYEDNMFVYDIEDVHTGKELYKHNIDDLITWANATNALDYKKHYIATVDDKGKEKEIEVFEYISLIQNADGFAYFDITYCPIKEYINNPFVHTYIQDNMIKKLEPKKSL